MAFDNIVGRADLTDAMLPGQVITTILKEAPSSSVILERARRVPMSSAKTKQPVLASLPEAYWVEGDTGLKQTTESTWENVTMTAEELAVIVPIPDALVADSDVPLWDEIRPLLVEAIGKKVDQAALFGVDKPSSWPTAVVPAAIAAENVTARGTAAAVVEGAIVQSPGKSTWCDGAVLRSCQN
ncbi:MAG: phage major capsid protein [Corynebacterium sp.]|uniref:phage major capsid protein n=1 Tax=Corynebacterium sp. TaxID=1720 RepID=UPI0026DEAB87|nr:phage major capsid protein [Corynebacterium sp.]MDO5670497.1 phage major capsid protein [Corynebacterium sp.]